MADNRIRTDNPLGSAVNGRSDSRVANNLLNSIRGNQAQRRVSSRINLIGQNTTRYRSISSGSARRAPLSTQDPRGTRSAGQTQSTRSSTNSPQGTRSGMRSQSTSNAGQGGRVSRDGLLMMLIDKDGNNRIDLEEVLLYVIKLKSENRQIPSSLYRLHPKFEDVVKSLDLVDTNQNLSIENSEAINALLKDRAGLIEEQGIDPEVANFVINYLKDNVDGINSALEQVDTNPDNSAEISDLEVLGALLASRRGELDINDPHIDMVLRTNSNYTYLLGLVAGMSIDFNGNVTDEQAFDILLALRGDDVGETIIQQALFLSTNQNLAELENSVALFDNEEDGQISHEEFINVMMQTRRNDSLAEEHELAINILRNKEPYGSILAIIEALDSGNNGHISDDEVIDFTLASLRGDINVDAALVEEIIHDNSNVDLIRNLINQVDTESDSVGEISNEEFLIATTQLLTDGTIGPASQELINKIIRHNPNSAEILNILDFIDDNNDNEISNNEAVEAIIASYRNETSGMDPQLYQMVLDLNPERANLQTIIDLINPSQDGHPSIDDSFNFIIDYKNGALSQDDNLIRLAISKFPEAQAILDTYELMETGGDNIDLREYTTALIAMNSGAETNPGTAIMTKFTEYIDNADIVNEGIATLDTITVDGLVSAEEFLNNFNQLFLRTDGTVDMAKLNIFLSVSDIIYPDSNALNQFIHDVDTRVETPVNIISNTEVIDALFNLNNHSISDPGPEIVNVVLSRNPNKTTLANLVTEIDTDNDGEINNIELTRNLLKFRKGEFTEDPALVQYILNKNTNFNEINNLINSFDRDVDGVIGDLELFVELISNRSGSYPGLTDSESNAIIAELIAGNPRSSQIAAVVEGLDPNQSGTVDHNELVAAYLAINAGTLADFSDEMKNLIPNIDGDAFGSAALVAEDFVDSVDADLNGQISDLEIANLLLADRAFNTLSSYSTDLVTAIFNNNGNRTSIEALLNELDPNRDGLIERTEVISAILEYREEPANAFNGVGASPFVDQILSHNSEFNQIKSLIETIDGDNDGQISDQEAMNTLVGIAKGEIDTNIANQIIDKNDDINDIRTAFNNFGIDFDSSNLVAELFATWVDIQQGLRDDNYFNELVNALGITDFGNLTTQFHEIDTDHDNIISPSEYGELMVDIITGTKSASDYQLLVNILERDPNLAPIRTIVDSFNLDGDNNLADHNVVDGIRAIRNNGDLNIMNEGFIQTILSRNPHSEGILKLLDLADPTKTNSFDLHYIVHTVWIDTIRRVGSTNNADLAYDFNGNGRVDNNDKDTVIRLHSYINNSVYGFAVLG